jgi:hypothetical protein
MGLIGTAGAAIKNVHEILTNPAIEQYIGYIPILKRATVFHSASK